MSEQMAQNVGHQERVVMWWPTDLKQEIQARVGKRGLTAYVLNLVEAEHEVWKTTPRQLPEKPLDEKPERSDT